jgi:predicted nucleic acid-binding Zn ribbon protein
MQRLGDAVRNELGRFGSAGAMADVVDAWPGAVGETIAANAWPARLARDGTLHVSAGSSAWDFELQQLEGEILPRLREAVGGDVPRRLKFAPGTLPEAATPSPDALRVPSPEPSPEQSALARELTAGIASEDLRKSVEKAARMSLARVPDDRSV